MWAQITPDHYINIIQGGGVVVLVRGKSRIFTKIEFKEVITLNAEITPNKTNEVTTVSGRLAALRQRAVHAAETWQPESGETLIGELIGSQKAVGTYGENFQMLIKDETGTIIACWLTPWLREFKGTGRGNWRPDSTHLPWQQTKPSRANL